MPQRHALNGPAPRGRPRDPSLDDAILGAAVALVQDVGIGHFSINEVARRAGVPKSSLYRRWESRQELLRAALTRLSEATPGVPDTGSLRGDLIQVVHRRMQALEGSEAALARIALEARHDRELSPVVREVLEQRRRAYYPILQRALARGELRPDVDFDAMLDLVFGALWSRVITQRERDVGAAEDLVERALRGLLPRN